MAGQIRDFEFVGGPICGTIYVLDKIQSHWEHRPAGSDHTHHYTLVVNKRQKCFYVHSGVSVCAGKY